MDAGYWPQIKRSSGFTWKQDLKGSQLNHILKKAQEYLYEHKQDEIHNGWYSIKDFEECKEAEKHYP